MTKQPSRQFDKVKLPTTYALLGNADNTPLPIVNPCTGEINPIYHTKAFTQFLEEHPEQEGVIMRSILKRIKDLTGIGRIRDLSRIAELNGEHLEIMIRNTRAKILSRVGFLDKYVDSRKDGGLRQMGRISNEFINDLVNKFFPDSKYELSLKNEVENCNDAARLLFMTLNTTLDPRVRYEARRKLILIELLGKIVDYTDAERSHEDALSDMMILINEQMVSVPEGGKKGATEEKFLVSRHTTQKRKTTQAFIEAKPPKKERTTQRVTPMGIRRGRVLTNEKEERQIFFHYSQREKRTSARLLKAIRYNDPIGERESDRNGIR